MGDAEEQMQDIRDKFYIGAYEDTTQKIAASTPSNEFVEAEKMGIGARCLLGLGKFGELKPMMQSEVASQKATAYMTMYQKSPKPEQRQNAFEQLMDLAKTSKDATSCFLAACAQAMQGDVLEAVNITQTYTGQTAEIQGLRTQLLMMMHQPLLAEKQMKELHSITDESSIAKVVAALVNMGKGDYQEAFLLYCDVEAAHDEIGQTNIIVNGKAASNLQRGNWSDAMEDLSTLPAAEQATSPEFIVNSCCAAVNQGQAPDEYLMRLAGVAKTHSLLTDLERMDQAFAKFGKAAA